MTDAKPGWRTSEFWLKLLATILTMGYASGLIPTTGTTATVAAIVATMLGALGYTVARTMAKAPTAAVEVVVPKGTGAATMLAVLLLGVAAVGSSGCAASSRESTIKTAMVAVDASSAAFLAFDKAHQDEIVAHATSLEDGKAKLAAYREKQETVRKAFVVAYTAIGVAATVNDDHSIAGLQAALQQVLAAVVALTGGVP